MKSRSQSPDPGNKPSTSNIERFIIARVNELIEIGWSKSAVAEALGVDVSFIEACLRAR